MSKRHSDLLTNMYQPSGKSRIRHYLRYLAASMIHINQLIGTGDNIRISVIFCILL